MVYFVGMHNKPGFEPLDSRTYSGKIIDRVIQHIGPAIKTNLTSEEHIPDSVNRAAALWHVEHETMPGDYVILLGRWVQKNFYRAEWLNIVCVPHPASFAVRGKVDEYIKSIKEKIN